MQNCGYRKDILLSIKYITQYPMSFDLVNTPNKNKIFNAIKGNSS